MLGAVWENGVETLTDGLPTNDGWYEYLASMSLQARKGLATTRVSEGTVSYRLREKALEAGSAAASVDQLLAFVPLHSFGRAKGADEKWRNQFETYLSNVRRMNPTYATFFEAWFDLGFNGCSGGRIVNLLHAAEQAGDPEFDDWALRYLWQCDRWSSLALARSSSGKELPFSAGLYGGGQAVLLEYIHGHRLGSLPKGMNLDADAALTEIPLPGGKTPDDFNNLFVGKRDVYAEHERRASYGTTGMFTWCFDNAPDAIGLCLRQSRIAEHHQECVPRGRNGVRLNIAESAFYTKCRKLRLSKGGYRPAVEQLIHDQIRKQKQQ